MSAPGADPLAAIRQRLEAVQAAYSPGVTINQSVKALDWFEGYGVEAISTLLAMWDTRESAIRALVAQWKQEADQLKRLIARYTDEDDWESEASARAELRTTEAHIYALERLLSGPQP